MKGNVNAAFVADKDGSEVKAEENSYELREISSFGNSAPNEENDEKRVDNIKINALARGVLRIRYFMAKSYRTENYFVKLSRIVAVNGLAMALLVSSVVQHINSGSPTVDWCNDVGLFWILYTFVYVVLLTSAIKRMAGESFNDVAAKALRRIEKISANRFVKGTCYSLPVALIGAYVIIFPGKSGRRIVSFFGVIVFVLMGFLCSKYPGHVKWRTVVSGIVIQFAVGALAINWESGRNVVDCMGNKVTTFLSFSEKGAEFAYGFLAKPLQDSRIVFAFSVLPVIYFLSFFVNILSYYGILQWFIFKISWFVRLIMGTTVCESVNAVASIFLGMSEAPLLIKGYLKDLTESEICSILCAGWSTVAGIVLAAYIKFGVKSSHLLSASVMSAPASLSISKLFYPETEVSKNKLDNLELRREEGSNVLDAASRGAISAIAITFGIIANIIAILSFLGFIDGILGWMGMIIGYEKLSVKFIMSKLFIPISYLIGVDTDSLEDVAYLVGIKTVANEFQAYQILGEWIQQNRISRRSEILATYALCGFSNFGSIGISVGALTVIEPSQSSSITKVALHAFIASNIVCFMTACIAGCLVD